MALPGNPYDGQTLEKVVPAMENTIGAEMSASSPTPATAATTPQSHKFRVFTAGQKRRVTPAIKRETRRRSAVEPVSGHIKNEHRMGCN